MPAPAAVASASKNTSKADKPPVLQAFSLYGIANQDGIVFSSLNGISTVQNPSSSLFGSIFSPASPALSQASNSNTNTNSNQAAAASANQINSVQASGQSALTFAPLAPGSVSSTTLHPNRPIQRPPINPSVFSPSMASSSNQYVVTRPENQCGLSNVTKSRVVGGDITQIGKRVQHLAQSSNQFEVISLSFPGQYPWIAALGYRFPNTSIYGIQFHCAGSLITLTHVLTTAHCISDYLYVIHGIMNCWWLS